MSFGHAKERHIDVAVVLTPTHRLDLSLLESTYTP